MWLNIKKIKILLTCSWLLHWLTLHHIISHPQANAQHTWPPLSTLQTAVYYILTVSPTPPVLLSYQKRGHLTNHKTLKFTQFTNSTGVDCYHHDNAASWSGHQDRWKRQWKQWNYLCWNLQPIMVTAKQQKPPPPSWWKEASKRKEQNLNSQKQAYFVQ